MPGHVSEACCRSYAMNNWIGHYSPRGDSPGFLEFIKMSDFVRPGPAKTFVILDNGSNINDGWFMLSLDGFDPRNPNAQAEAGFWDQPGSYHGRAFSLSFADGHSEIHKWQQYDDVKHIPASAGDVDWLQ